MAVDLFEDYAGKSRRVQSDEARQPTFNEIPIIDIAPFLKPNATEEERMKVVKEVRYACEQVGFLYVKGHGLTESSMEKAFLEAKKFFMMTTEEKMETYFRLSPKFRGYEPSKGATHAKGDLKEAFNFGYDPVADPLNPSNDFEEFLAANPSAGPNVWPSSSSAASGLKNALFDYYGQVLVLGRQMIRIFALALDLPENYFDEAFRVPGALGRTLYYPTQPPATDLDDGTIGVGAHTDIECFTCLLQGPDLSCLQVLNKAGEWVEAPPVPGTLVINVGDMLSRWTNNRFISTVHRVINKTGQPRQSMPVFFGPNYETMWAFLLLLIPWYLLLTQTSSITALPGSVPAGEKPKFATIQAGEYVQRRLARSRLGTKYDESVPIEQVLAGSAAVAA
ncbi:hypothetical protein MNV49_005710 [Pseudohyphozyma bogoriensis]|nr:hypothetical protein MNV49_005710 [Pseudohyphozyma bogoriensis]